MVGGLERSRDGVVGLVESLADGLNTMVNRPGFCSDRYVSAGAASPD